MRVLTHFIVLTSAACLMAPALAASRQTKVVPKAYEAEVSQYAEAHGLPESLVHRIILRESRYNPQLVSKRGHYGLMQISYGTARSMGYKGAPAGLLDPETNLTYGVPYLANAYRAAGNSESGAVTLYSQGYYQSAKRKGLLSQLRTADSPSLAKPPEPVPAKPPVPKDDGFLRFFRAPAPEEAPAEAAPAESGQP